MRRVNRPARDRGLTLIELVVAILVLSIGALAAARANDQSARALSGAMPRLLATIVAENRAEELRLFGPSAPLPGTVTVSGQTFTLSTTREATAGGLIQATITVQSEAGPGATLVTFIPPRGVAQ